MRKNWILVLFCMLMTCIPPKPAEIVKENDVSKLENSTIVLLQPSVLDEKYVGFCAGVAISPTEILTAKHCIVKFFQEGNEKLEDHLIEGLYVPFKTFEQGDIPYDPKAEGKISTVESPHFAVVRKISNKTDLALLETKEIKLIYTEREINEPKVGEEVQILGHPAGFEYTYFKGMISSVRFNNMVHITAPVFGGNSGGGAFTKNNKLIGICSYYMVAVPNMSYFVNNDRINEFVGEYYGNPK